VGSEIVEEVDLDGAWRRFFLRDPLVVAPGRIAALVGRGPAILGRVADSDYCLALGVLDGEVRWEWSFGEAPWDPAPAGAEAADPGSIAQHAQDVSRQIVAWGHRADLSPIAADGIAEVLDRGYDFAEEGLFALLQVLRLAPATPEEHGPVVPSVRNARVRRPIHIWNGPARWVLCQFNTTVDLYDHLGAVAAWLEQARQLVMLPLVASYSPMVVRTSIGPHESIEGAPGGLLVRSGGWSMKNRPVFGSGDEAGWSRKLRQLSRKELREVNLHATGFGPSGHWHDGPGEVELAAILRDQFTRDAPAPLPAEHPGQLKVWARTEMMERLPGFDFAAVLKHLGQLAIDTIPGDHAFMELSRPLSGRQEVVPVSPVAWTSPIGAVKFRPETVVLSDPPHRPR
jgi:hypothetical protein